MKYAKLFVEGNICQILIYILLRKGLNNHGNYWTKHHPVTQHGITGKMHRR